MSVWRSKKNGVYPIFIMSKKGVFTCPLCGKENQHGLVSGHRVAHCNCYPHGYFVAISREDAQRLLDTNKSYLIICETSAVKTKRCNNGTSH